MYHWSELLALKNALTLKSHEFNYMFQIQRSFFNKKLLCKFGNEFSGHWGKDDATFFNPTFSFTDKQLAPYSINGSFNGDLSLNLSRDISENTPWGYQIGLELTPDKMTVSPTFFY